MRTYLPVVTILKVQTSGYDKDRIQEPRQEHTSYLPRCSAGIPSTACPILFILSTKTMPIQHKEKVIIVTTRTVPLK